MKQNQYTESVNKVKAPKKAVEKAISGIYSASLESEVIIMKNPKKTLKFVSAIAAVLAVIVAIGAFTFTADRNSANDKSAEAVKLVNAGRAFALTANSNADDTSTTADEIGPEAYVKIAEIKGFTSGAHYLADSLVLADDGYYVPADSTRKLLSLSQEFNLDITCEGEDIESITYTANNSCLAYYDSYEGFMSAVDLTSEEIDRYNASGSINYNKWASACTFDYDCQPKSSWDKTAVVFEGDDVFDGTMPLRIHFTFEFEKGKYTFEVDDEENSDAFKSIFEKEFNAHADEFSLDVTANYKDGSSYTKTLKFKCEVEGNFCYLYAIEV